MRKKFMLFNREDTGQELDLIRSFWIITDENYEIAPILFCHIKQIDVSDTILYCNLRTFKIPNLSQAKLT